MAVQRGKNFGPTELKQLCYSYLVISQDPCVGSGQKKENFWERVAEHYERHRPKEFEAQTSKSLESKWGEVRHDVTKFSGCFQAVEDMNILGSNQEDTVEKAHELYKQKHVKGKYFNYIDCYWILKDCPRWAMPQDTTMKQKARAKERHSLLDNFDKGNLPPPHLPSQACNEYSPNMNTSGEGQGTPSHIFKRPTGNKMAKEIAKKSKSHDDVMKIIAETGQQRMNLLEQSVFVSMFTMPTEHLDQEEKEFWKAWRVQELNKVKMRMTTRQIATPDIAKRSNVRIINLDEPEENIEPISPTTNRITIEDSQIDIQSQRVDYN